MKVTICWMAEKKPDFISRMVMRVDKAPYSHVLVRFNDRFGVDSIYHATGKGVHIQPFRNYLDTHKIVYSKVVHLKCTNQFFWGYISGSDGKEYSRWQIFRIFTGVSWFKNGKAKMICSETVGELLHYHSKYQLEGDRDLWTPRYLYEVFKG